MQLTSKVNKDFECLLCIIDICSKYGWVVPLKDEKDMTITNALQIFLDESNRKLIKTWVDKGSEFFNRSMKLWSEFNDIEIYTANYRGKSVVAERFIRALKNKTYKSMTSVSKKVHIDKLVEILYKYNNKYHSTIKMKDVVVNLSTSIDFSKENNKEHPKFKVGNDVRISKYKSIFVKGYTQDWSELVFVIRKVKKILCRGHVLLVILTVKKFLERFKKNNCKKQIKKSLELKMKSNEELINHILNAKATIILLTVGLIKMSVK